MKTLIFGALKYVSLFFGLMLLIGTIVTVDTSEKANDYTFITIVGIGCILLAIFFQGEQNRTFK
ncbi:hypothetical protein ACQCN2_09455 [Brevibacillus ginsengisoli]|uniref:hypothetical protein n=1 Tax=Brevibacillus ginsengisoli TaxID=363854 RepID=UPI003CF6A1B3